MPLTIKEWDLAKNALPLRAKISHSWLDHEILMVPESLAVERWRRSEWPPIANRWLTLHRLALSFADTFEEFSAATLVDKLPYLKDAPPVVRSDVVAKLVKLQVGLVDLAALRAQYLQCLEVLWAASEKFFMQVNELGADERSVANAWTAVRDAGSELKVMFSSGQIPDGVLLP